MPSKNFHPNLHYSAFLKEKARQLRNNPTPAEKHFWNSLRRMPLYKEVSFNRQKPLGKYIVDFYSHRLKLVIENDGDTHGETTRISYDLNRTQYFKSKGLRILRFTNREVLENIAGVLCKIEELVEEQDGKSPNPLYKRGNQTTLNPPGNIARSFRQTQADCICVHPCSSVVSYCIAIPPAPFREEGIFILCILLTLSKILIRLHVLSKPAIMPA